MVYWLQRTTFLLIGVREGGFAMLTMIVAKGRILGVVPFEGKGE